MNELLDRRATRDEMERKETCIWTLESEFDAEIWNTSCGTAWSFVDDGPEENGCNFCHRCGGALQVVRPPIEADDDEDAD